MSSPDYQEQLGYDPSRLFVPDLEPSGQFRDDLVQQAAAKQREQLLQEAIDSSFAKRIATSMSANTGRGIGTAMGIGAWVVAGTVAGAASGVIYNWAGEITQSAMPYIQPYTEIAGNYLYWLGNELPPKPDSLVGLILEEAKPKPGTMGEKVVQFVVDDASPVIGRGIMNMAEIIRENVISNLTSIGAVVGGAIGLEKSSPYADKLGRTVASPLVRTHMGFSRLMKPFRK